MSVKVDLFRPTTHKASDLYQRRRICCSHVRRRGQRWTSSNQRNKRHACCRYVVGHYVAQQIYNNRSNGIALIAIVSARCPLSALLMLSSGC